MKPVLLALVGPTGVGKTNTALALAQALNAEIVSMDSMQVYRSMDIGTAKPSAEELSRIRHHMIDVVDPSERFTTAAYRDMAFEVIEGILRRGKQPLLVGGTGLYLNALSYEMHLGEKGADSTLREQLLTLASETGGAQKLHNRLAALDPLAAQKLHPNDVRRVVRAIEIVQTSGQARQYDEAKQEGPYHVLVYGLSMPREQMYARINARVDAMMKAGLVDEVRTLLMSGVEPKQEGGAMQAIGYKEMVSALRGDISMECAVDLIKQNSRRYAKRQWTWFRHDERTQWFDVSQYPNEKLLQQALLKRMNTDQAAYLLEAEQTD